MSTRPAEQTDTELVELAAQLVAQRLVERAFQHVVGAVHDGHVLVGEEGLDLPGELEARRPGATLGAGQLPGVDGIAGPETIAEIKGRAMLLEHYESLFDAGVPV